MNLLDAVRTLGTVAKISVASDQTLADSIAVGQAAKHPNLAQKAVITPAIGLHGDLAVCPISALLELARGTVLNYHSSVGAFANNWSILRYLGIFSLNSSGYLQLDKDALKFIGPNQRRVLSEDLGIGFGIVAGKRWCRKRTHGLGPVGVIDVDRALYKGSVPHLKAGIRQPDYLLAYQDPKKNGAMIYDLLETKGTVNRSTAKDQLSRAVTQLAGLTVNHKPMTGIAVSTVSNASGFHVMAVDPDEDPATWEPEDPALERWRASQDRSRQDAAQLDVSAEELFANATNVGYASLARFGGHYQAARKWLPNVNAGQSALSDSDVRRDTAAGVFFGAEHFIEIPGTHKRLRVYQGVAEGVLNGLKALDVSAVMNAQRAFAEVSGDETDALAGRGGNTESPSALTSDGSMLEVSVV